MGKLKPEQSQGNVNVTLDPPGAGLPETLGKEFPCPLCGAGLPILTSKRKKPYCTCNLCGIQAFRARESWELSRLNKMAKDGNSYFCKGRKRIARNYSS